MQGFKIDPWALSSGGGLVVAVHLQQQRCCAFATTDKYNALQAEKASLAP